MMRDMRPVVYCAGPFKGNVKANVAAAEACARKVWEAGAACISPHMNTVALDGDFPEKVFLEGDLAILHKCDAVLMMPTWKASAGATKERFAAMHWGIPVLYSIEELKDWIEARNHCEG
jgi:hypothetical protein